MRQIALPDIGFRPLKWIVTIVGHIEIRQLAEGARVRRASWAASALRMPSWMSPMRRTRSGSASSFSEALTSIAFDHARIHPSLGLSKLRVDNVIEHHRDDMGDGSRCTAEVFKSRHSI